MKTTPPITNLAVCPPSIFEANRAALAEARVRQRRHLAIAQAGYECECGWLAWSKVRLADLEIRERNGEPNRPRVLCPICAKRCDEKDAKRQQRRAG